MAKHDLSARQLRAFIALTELRSFTKAAHECNLSQPAFSVAIQALEQSVSAQLFKRDRRSVELTPEGRLFEPAARRLLEDMSGILNDLSDHVEKRKGRVRLAALPSLSAGWLPEIFAEYMSRWPGISVSSQDALSERCIDLVRTGQVDFAIAAYGALPPSDLTEKQLCSDGFHMVCRQDHPLAKERKITPEKIAKYPFIRMSRPSGARQSFEAALGSIRLNVVFEAEQMATILGLVEAGIGVTVIPTLTLIHANREILAVKPLTLPPNLPSLRRDIYVVQRRDGAISVASQSMLDLIFKRLGNREFV